MMIESSCIQQRWCTAAVVNLLIAMHTRGQVDRRPPGLAREAYLCLRHMQILARSAKHRTLILEVSAFTFE